HSADTCRRSFVGWSPGFSRLDGSNRPLGTSGGERPVQQIANDTVGEVGGARLFAKAENAAEAAEEQQGCYMRIADPVAAFQLQFFEAIQHELDDGVARVKPWEFRP